MINNPNITVRRDSSVGRANCRFGNLKITKYGKHSVNYVFRKQLGHRFESCSLYKQIRNFMKNRFEKTYEPLNKDWWSDNQKDKQCKKTTPDKAFKKNDKIRVLFDTESFGIPNKIIRGDYIFDSYDAYDNTCFIKVGEITQNISLLKIKKIINLKNVKFTKQ